VHLKAHPANFMYKIMIDEPREFFNEIKIRPIVYEHSYYNFMPTVLPMKGGYPNFPSKYDGQHRYVIGKKTVKSRITPPASTSISFDYISEIRELQEQPEFVYDISVFPSQRFYGGLGQI
jgi:hypothetical protein